MTELVATTGLTKRFGGLTAVDEVSYLVPEGQIAGVIGPNGSGKTTLFNMLSGYFPPTRGRILFQGKDITAEPPHRRVALGIARTFQLVSVFSTLSVWENLVLPTVRFREGGRGPWRLYLRSARHGRVVADCEAALEAVGLTAQAEEPVAELSYGDKRLLEIAMALALRPSLLLLDEPLAGLSDFEIGQILTLIESLQDEFTLVIIEHKISKITGLVQSLGVMNEGRLICQGSPETVLADPQVRECYWGKEEPC
jgi:branched-chain amino acid transport system ATP-binding protein